MTDPGPDLRSLVDRALVEDAPRGDVTSSLVIPADARCRAELRVKTEGVLAGTRAAGTTFEAAAQRDGLGPVEVEWKAADGDEVRPGDVLAIVRGPARTVLRAERVALNLLGHLAGVATLTHAFVRAAAPARVLHTRKTMPGLRALEREAVLAGGGSLHRDSLSESILIKDNHLQLVGSLTEAVRRGKASGLPVEVEAETLAQVREALEAGADRILLDNPTPDLVGEAAALVGDPDRLEVSGGVTLDSVGSLVAAGARLVSVGRLTHSAPALDICVDVTNEGT